MLAVAIVASFLAQEWGASYQN